MRPLLLGCFLLCLPVLAQAAPYRDTVWPLSFVAPRDWRVSVLKEDGRRLLLVKPQRMEDRERGGARAALSVRKLKPRESLKRLARQYRKAQGGREAATSVNLDEKRNRLTLDYRAGEYVQNGLWIVRRHIRVMQLVPGKRQLIDADCSANASEFHHYRQAFASVCLGFVLEKEAR